MGPVLKFLKTLLDFTIRVLEPVEEVLIKIEYVLIVIMLLVMCFLAFGQVILRNFFSYSLVWADVVVRMGVLWVAILGACIASARWERGHIHIDLFSKILPHPFSEYLDAALSLAACIACFIFFYISTDFVMVEKKVGSIVHILNTPEWYFTLIFPIGFLLMSFKFFLCFLEDLGGQREVE